MRTRYYLTKVKRECRCRACEAKLRVGEDMVFRKDGPVTLCLRDADGDPLVDYRPSLRWEKAQHVKQRPRGSRPIPEANPHLHGRKAA